MARRAGTRQAAAATSDRSSAAPEYATARILEAGVVPARKRSDIGAPDFKARLCILSPGYYQAQKPVSLADRIAFYKVPGVTMAKS